MNATENDMLKKLRTKFVALICGVTALVLVVSFWFIAWSDHNSKVIAVYTELQGAVETTVSDNARDMEQRFREAMDEVLNGKNQDKGNRGWSALEENVAVPHRIGDRMQASWSFPIALYFVDENAQAFSLTDDSTAAVSDSVLNQALTSVLESNDDQGLLETEGLYFARFMQLNGSFIVAFADQGVVGNNSHLARILLLAGLIILALVFVLATFFSRWALRPVQEAWDAQQQFIADASHEMKTPLTVILANAAIALKKPQATVAEQSQWIEGIQDEATNMEQLVLDMLALAQPKNVPGKAALTELVNLSDLAERASLQFEAVAFERGILVDDQVEQDVTLKGDPAQLQRMIGTLVDNAIKYAAPDTTIDISLKTAGHDAVLSVHNWGEPIPAEDLPHVFDRFYRSDKSRDRSGEDGSHSFGLGLAIAQKIAQQHKGSLSVTSSEAEGTTFTARFPRG